MGINVFSLIKKTRKTRQTYIYQPFGCRWKSWEPAVPCNELNVYKKKKRCMYKCDSCFAREERRKKKSVGRNVRVRDKNDASRKKNV